MEQNLLSFKNNLIQNEKATSTISKYIHEIHSLFHFLQDAPLNKESILKYRQHLEKEYTAVTINGKLSAINAYLSYCGLECHKVKLLKVQRRAFIEEKRELTSEEYKQLLQKAYEIKNLRLYYLLLTLGSTGIRISELPFITVKAVQKGYAEIRTKGKSRMVILPSALVKKLNVYIAMNQISDGHVFRTKNNRPMDRSNICREMKNLALLAKVPASKVFPHNFRHLFARSFYHVEKNLAHLADILGHSSIETTRIYVATSLRQHEKRINQMQLIW